MTEGEAWGTVANLKPARKYKSKGTMLPYSEDMASIEELMPKREMDVTAFNKLVDIATLNWELEMELKRLKRLERARQGKQNR